jgi:hypothetical protein
MPMRNLASLALALIAIPACAQTLAHDPATGRSWVIREALSPTLRPTLPADGRAENPTRLPTRKERVHDIRVAKCARVWRTCAPWSYDPALVEFFISECERWGIGDQWLPLLTYGMANFGLRVNATAPGRCYGPFDVKWPYCSRSHAAHVLDGPWRESALRDPYVNTACHVGQAAEYHRRTGRTGMALLRTVFYPAAPRGRATNAWAPRWEKWDRKFRRVLSEGY